MVFDTAHSDVKVYKVMQVVEEVEDPATELTLDEAKRHSRKAAVGGTVEIEMKTKNFGRISAQAAKQVIIQGIREAERGMMIKEYESKREDIITATVQKLDPNGNVVVDTGTSFATLLKEEQLPGDRFCRGAGDQGVRYRGEKGNARTDRDAVKDPRQFREAAV